MGKLNASRDIPYQFKVVLFDEWVWLYDDSVRTYIASSTPTMYLEPLYYVGPARILEGDDEAEEPPDWDGPYPDPTYLSAYSFGELETADVSLDEEWTAPTCPEADAWDAAREEARANHIL